MPLHDLRLRCRRGPQRRPQALQGRGLTGRPQLAPPRQHVARHQFQQVIGFLSQGKGGPKLLIIGVPVGRLALFAGGTFQAGTVKIDHQMHRAAPARIFLVASQHKLGNHTGGRKGGRPSDREPPVSRREPPCGPNAKKPGKLPSRREKRFSGPSGCGVL